jgi:TRAP transporter 4TM/12TM fusion protein
MVHFEACRAGLGGVAKDDVPAATLTLKRGWHFFVPITVLIILLVANFSPAKAAFYTILSLIAVTALRKEYRHTLSPRRLANALAAGARDSLVVGATAAVVGIIIASIILPGMGLKFSYVVLRLSKGILPLAIFLVILASYILGMGLTVTASYLVLVVLAAPALVDMGVPLLTAHLLVFWYSQDATITPPVCLSAYVASGIAKSDVWKTGFYSLRVGLGLYYIPFLFVYTPLLLNGPLSKILWAIAAAIGGILALGGAFQGFWLKHAGIFERFVLGVAALCFFWPLWKANLAGLGLVMIITFYQFWAKKSFSQINDQPIRENDGLK